jgi:hypothetical protein
MDLPTESFNRQTSELQNLNLELLGFDGFARHLHHLALHLVQVNY